DNPEEEQPETPSDEQASGDESGDAELEEDAEADTSETSFRLDDLPAWLPWLGGVAGLVLLSAIFVTLILPLLQQSSTNTAQSATDTPVAIAAETTTPRPTSTPAPDPTATPTALPIVRVRFPENLTGLQLLDILNAFAATQSELELQLTNSGDANPGTTQFVSVQNGVLDALVMGRDFTRQEREDFPDLASQVIGYSAFAIMVGTDVDVDSLTPEEIRDIFAGRIDDWRAITGQAESAQIQRVVPISDFSAHTAFRQTVMQGVLFVFGTGLRVQEANYGGVWQTMQFTANAIGVTPVQEPLPINQSVKQIEVNDVAPTPETIADGSYVLLRPITVVTQAQRSPNVELLVEAILTAEARRESFVVLGQPPTGAISIFDLVEEIPPDITPTPTEDIP
ncbi:MAG: hypothetical protein GYB68_12645, partial [Chloroflexi bacterium]|nr:hypothetical protein [Chloroflexota bacterium]